MAQWARDENGFMLFPTAGNGAAAIVTDAATCAEIKIPSVFGLVLGEWILDTTLGFPWRQIWGQKNPNLFGIRQLFRKALLAINVGMPPVASIVDLSTLYDANKRSLAYKASVRLATGQVVTVPPVTA
jgi:hypothetical protein